MARIASTTLTLIEFPIRAWNELSDTLLGIWKRSGSMCWSRSISTVFKRRPRVEIQLPPA